MCQKSRTCERGTQESETWLWINLKTSKLGLLPDEIEKFPKPKQQQQQQKNGRVPPMATVSLLTRLDMCNELSWTPTRHRPPVIDSRRKVNYIKMMATHRLQNKKKNKKKKKQRDISNLSISFGAPPTATDLALTNRQNLYLFSPQISVYFMFLVCASCRSKTFAFICLCTHVPSLWFFDIDVWILTFELFLKRRRRWP